MLKCRTNHILKHAPREDPLNKRIKVCFVQPVQSPYWTERLKALARFDNLDVTLLLERENHVGRPEWHQEYIDGIRIEVLGSLTFSTRRDLNDIEYQSQGTRYIPWRIPIALWRLKPDIIVLCNATQILATLPLRKFLRFSIALLVEDTARSTRNHTWFNKTLKTWAYRRANHWFVFSDDARSYLAQIGINSEVEYSPWSVDMALFKQDPKHSLPLLEKAQAERFIVFIGRFLYAKGLFPLLEAWAHLSPEIRSNARLLLVGDGPLRERAEKLCADRTLSDVIFLGQVPYDQVKAILGMTDLFILPTLEDVYGLVILEAMASGCPVIITPFTGARELVKPDINGWIVDPLQPGALAAALTHALSADVDLTKMGQAARARVRDMDNGKVMFDLAQSLTRLAENGR